MVGIRFLEDWRSEYAGCSRGLVEALLLAPAGFAKSPDHPSRWDAYLLRVEALGA